MQLLALDTATRQLGVALIADGQVRASYELLADYPHAVELPGAVTRVLQAAGASLARLDGFIIDIGPGSFTGLRIGLAFLKALAFAHRKPAVAVPSLDVLAAAAPLSDGRVCPVLDARQGNVYTARYRLEGGRMTRETGYLLGPADGLLAQMRDADVFLGDGCAPYRERILNVAARATIAPHDFWLPRVATLARLGAERFDTGQRDDPATLVPLYLYPLDCSVRGPGRPTSVLPPRPVPASRSS